MKPPRALPKPHTFPPLVPRSSCRPRCLSANLPTQCRTFLRPRQRPSARGLQDLDIDRIHAQYYKYHARRQAFLYCGVIAGMVAICGTSYLLYQELNKPTNFDSSAGPNPGSRHNTTVIVYDAKGKELVPTGNSTVPNFPRQLDLALGTAAAEGEPQQQKPPGDGEVVEYTLVGLGVRTVSFLSIQVYMVGYYVATQDIAAIQSRLVKEINPIATTLVAGEREELRAALLDPVQGERLWGEILREARPRSLFRVVPVRDTDFHHLKDGFVRAITARLRARGAAGDDSGDYGDDAFREAMRDFRAAFNRGKAPRGRELLLVRDGAGRLTIAFDDGRSRGAMALGSVADERVSRLLWLNYLAGAKVASEPARRSVIDGVMEFVERPVGTVATQVI
ncbi:chalcone isomerase [Durotheca rogersii]|uniref:chalcone isomerase n=1 Tax=Durotheca rogersii TaxID=419775 RepID=UPI0022200493|nr:chalcone isomerase [Durotheca rogersii]KAI5865277.1 chalcone isomerase [Durotheca rogersii]